MKKLISILSLLLLFHFHTRKQEQKGSFQILLIHLKVVSGFDLEFITDFSMQVKLKLN